MVYFLTSETKLKIFFYFSQNIANNVFYNRKEIILSFDPIKNSRIPNTLFSKILEEEKKLSPRIKNSKSNRWHGRGNSRVDSRGRFHSRTDSLPKSICGTIKKHRRRNGGIKVLSSIPKDSRSTKRRKRTKRSSRGSRRERERGKKKDRRRRGRGMI